MSYIEYVMELGGWRRDHTLKVFRTSLIFSYLSPERVYFPPIMFYFHWLALCLFSCSLAPLVVSGTPTTANFIQCGSLLPPESHAPALQDCIDAGTALFAQLPCPSCYVSHGVVLSNHDKTWLHRQYQLPKHAVKGTCLVGMVVDTPSGNALSTVAQLAKTLVYLFDHCVYKKRRDGGILVYNGVLMQIRVKNRQPTAFP
jgi:hypothetical protein